CARLDYDYDCPWFAYW
nr:immunoglobulin heavy chain junction region [Mus musculus]